MNINLSLSDPHAVPAFLAYADACAEDQPERAVEIRQSVATIVMANDEYVAIPEVRLPMGGGHIVVPPFPVAKYVAGKGLGGIPVSTKSAKPWVEINHFDAIKACTDAGLQLLTLSQALAISYLIAQVDENWTGGKVGEGDLYQGLHLNTVDEAQSADYESPNSRERRWHVLPDGQKIYDWSGNVWQRLFNDLHGDFQGVTDDHGIPPESLIYSLPQFPSEEKGMGYRYTPDDPKHWSGSSLVRGGSFGSRSRAGVFALDGYYPRNDWNDVGFRSTKQIGR